MSERSVAVGSSRAMSPVAIATDSTHYLPRSLADSQGIHQVSLYVGWAKDRSETDRLETGQQRELELENFDAFYERLGSDSEMPTTSQPSIGDFLAVWEPLLENGEDIVSVHLAGGISGTCEAARQAHGVLAERGLGERVEVIDGETACGGLGMLLLAGAAAARAGGDKDAVAARVREARKALRIWFCIDTLEYLRRGGRVGKAQAWLGGTLKIKPILSLEYEITPVERVRTAGRAFERMVQYVHELREAGSDAWVVQHIQATEQAQRLIDRGREIYGSEPLFVSEVGPVIGTYVGPGLIGVGGFPRTLLS
jgi:DegV family protein with EDD domain